MPERLNGAVLKTAIPARVSEVRILSPPFCAGSRFAGKSCRDKHRDFFTTVNTDQPILQELNQRRSVRGFLPKTVEQEKLDALWAAAQWAPSSSNKQEWRYYAVMGEARQKLAEVLNTGNRWALAAPLILCVVRDGSVENKSETREYGMYDVALSVMSLAVEAEHQGLRAHQMAGFREEAFRRVLHIPENEVPVVMVAVGYEGEPKELDPTAQAKEKRPRTRKPIHEAVTMVTIL